MKARIALADGDPRDAANVVGDALADKLDCLQPATYIELHAIGAVARINSATTSRHSASLSTRLRWPTPNDIWARSWLSELRLES